MEGKHLKSDDFIFTNEELEIMRLILLERTTYFTTQYVKSKNSFKRFSQDTDFEKLDNETEHYKKYIEVSEKLYTFLKEIYLNG